MLTNKAKYGLRAMCTLASSEQEWLQARAVAARARVPEKFLEAILLDLRRAGFVVSRRGHQGGHALAKPAEEIMVGDLIRAVDGPLAPVRCASMTAYEPCADCEHPDNCAVRELMRETRAALSGVLDHCSLKTLTHRSSDEPWLQSRAGGSR
ncbi:MAG: Rrf2 family transcriptional regulator [Xanthomonadaceae bacterium]|nr:Rrf2 family transcriptional regulator [Xanthomonadaceae bacterium]